MEQGREVPLRAPSFPIQNSVSKVRTRTLPAKIGQQSVPVSV